MRGKKSSNSNAQSTTGQQLTRREFVTRMTAAVLGTGHLLHTVAGGAPDSAATGMKYRQLGKTGIAVSEIGFGSHLSRPNMSDPGARAAQIRKGLDLGINLFDIYDHNYKQFAPMREILRPVRQQVLISLVSMSQQPEKEVEYALETLDTDTIDLYRLYVPLGSKDLLAARLEKLQRAKKQGKIRAIGLVGHSQTSLVEQLRTHAELDYLMFPYNFRHRKLSPRGAPQNTLAAAASPKATSTGWRDCVLVPCPDPVFAALVKKTGVGLIAMKPFGGGGLLQLPPPEQLRDQGAKISLPQAALKFILQSPQISCAIPAMNSIAQIEENVGALQGKGLSATEARWLQLYNEAAEKSEGSYLPRDYRWLEQWKI